MTKKNKTPFFWAFMIVHLAYVFVGNLLAYILNNDVFINLELPEGETACFMICLSIFAMVIPGIAAHYVYEKANRNWYIWLCPLVLMSINGLIWLEPINRGSRLLWLLPLGCDEPLIFDLGGINLDLSQVNLSNNMITFVLIVLLPSIIYAVCIFLAKLFARKPKADILENNKRVIEAVYSDEKSGSAQY